MSSPMDEFVKLAQAYKAASTGSESEAALVALCGCVERMVAKDAYPTDPVARSELELAHASFDVWWTEMDDPSKPRQPGERSFDDPSRQPRPMNIGVANQMSNQMTEERARELLGKHVHEGWLQDDALLGPTLRWGVNMDVPTQFDTCNFTGFGSKYTADDLEAIAFWMRRNRGVKP